MTTIKYFEDLEVWQLAREQAKQMYEVTTNTDLAKDFALKDQLNRASGSVMDNIAEGFGRGGNREFINYLSIARGSNSEVRSQILRVVDRSYINNEVGKDYLHCNQTIGVKLTNLITYLTKTKHNGPKFRR